MQTAIDDKNTELTDARSFLEELQEEYDMAYALFEEVNAERKAIEEEARAREVANQRNQIYEGVLSDTTWFPGVATAIEGRVTFFQNASTGWIQVGGRATVLSDTTALEASFSRFEGDALNGYSSEKMGLAG